jgi:hypothetical protein
MILATWTRSLQGLPATEYEQGHRRSRSIAAAAEKIIHPRTGETLQGAAPQGKGFTYPLRGKRRHLPEGHEIWLLTQNGRTAKVGPLGAVQVQYDPVNQTWEGQIN